MKQHKGMAKKHVTRINNNKNMLARGYSAKKTSDLGETYLDRPSYIDTQ